MAVRPAGPIIDVDQQVMTGTFEVKSLKALHQSLKHFIYFENTSVTSVYLFMAYLEGQAERDGLQVVHVEQDDLPALQQHLAAREWPFVLIAKPL